MAVFMDQKMTCLSVVEVAVEGTKARPELERGTKAEEGALLARAMAATAAVETVKNRTIVIGVGGDGIVLCYCSSKRNMM
mmetsp:Transcript_16878/g.40005  ORF Transcript_16878/g.40005 Transcript_16878/m.40005 type:complete len:80 (+) Transcript_16878:537-776(+)